MAGNIVPVVPVSEGQFICMWNGAFMPNVTDVKLPKQMHGRTEVHPGGRAVKISAPDGTVEYDDLEITLAQGEGIPQNPMYLWYLSVVEPLTGLGLPAVSVNQYFQVIDQNNAGLPMITHNLFIWPADRDHGTRQGGKDKDPRRIVMTYAVNAYQEVILL